MMEQSFPDSNRRELFDVDTFARLLERKNGEPTWSINSRESTPQYFFEEQQNAQVDYWRDIALSYGRDLRILDRREDYRTSIQSASYWEVEATHLRNEYWKIQGLGDCLPKPDSEQEDGPVSSRLRSRETEIPRSRKTKARKRARRSKTGPVVTRRVEKPQKLSKIKGASMDERRRHSRMQRARILDRAS